MGVKLSEEDLHVYLGVICLDPLNKKRKRECRQCKAFSFAFFRSPPPGRKRKLYKSMRLLCVSVIRNPLAYNNNDNEKNAKMKKKLSLECTIITIIRRVRR